MRSLRSLQRAFADSLINAQRADIAAQVRNSRIDSAGRLRVYRNNVTSTASGALAASFPVVVKLVGEDYFKFLARRYMREFPSPSGNLQDYGREFADFLGALAELNVYPYLPDVARLEWACQQAYHAAEPDRLNVAALAEVPPYRYSDLRFELHPSARLLQSEYPLLRIWQVNQAEHDGEISVSLDEGGDRLLVIRRAYAIEIERLRFGEYVLLHQLEQGRTMHYACECAGAADPEMNIAVTLRSHVARQTLTRFYQ